jgi:hypothetical protein
MRERILRMQQKSRRLGDRARDRLIRDRDLLIQRINALKKQDSVLRERIESRPLKEIRGTDGLLFKGRVADPMTDRLYDDLGREINRCENELSKLDFLLFPPMGRPRGHSDGKRPDDLTNHKHVVIDANLSRPKVHFRSNPELATRRAIVARNPKLPTASMCKRFDLDSVPLPEGWREQYDVENWVSAWNKSRLRSLINSIVSKDRRLAK